MIYTDSSPDKLKNSNKIDNLELQSPSIINKPTSRHHTIYQHSKIAQNLFDKSTQRNPIQYINKNPIWLTQSNSSNDGRKDWILPSNLKEIQLIQQQKEILTLLLDKNGVLQLLQYFEAFREYMIQNYYKIQNKGNRCNTIELIEWIQELKFKISNINKDNIVCNKPKEDISIDYSQIKQLLHQIANLRNQNMLLRHKIKKLTNQVRQFKDKSFIQDNSILDNSISFYSTTSKYSKDRNHSIDSGYNGYDIKKQKQIEGSIIDSWLEMPKETEIKRQNKMLETSYDVICKIDVGVNCSIITQFQQSIPTSSKTDLIGNNMQQKQKFIPRQSMQIYIQKMIKWKMANCQQCLSRCVVQLKKVLNSYFLAANLALLKSKSLQSFSTIINKQLPYQPIKSYDSISNQPLSIAEVNHLIDHLASISQSIHQLVKGQVYKLQ